MLFLLWLWLTWLVVLFGLEITVTIQALHGEGLEHLPAFGGHDDFVDVRWVLPLAAAVGEDRGTLEDVVEPFLIHEGFLARTPRGRVATRLSRDRFGVPLPGPGAAQPKLL